MKQRQLKASYTSRSRPAELRRQRSLSPRFSAVFFSIEALNAVLHLSELSDKFDVTCDTSKIKDR
jgi:NADPH-dependent ferric siderophore reductase